MQVGCLIQINPQCLECSTGLPKTSFDTLWSFVDPGEHCEKILFDDLSRRGNDIVTPGRNKEKGVVENQIFYS